jgi:hypothetical protein
MNWASTLPVLSASRSLILCQTARPSTILSFDILCLTESERNEVYWAVCELVKNRLEKARSV